MSGSFKALILSKKLLFIMLADALLNVGMLHSQKEVKRQIFPRPVLSFILLQNKDGFLCVERKKSRLALRVTIVQ